MRRSRYKHYWYGIALAAVKNYDKIKAGHSIQDAILVNAIQKTLDETQAYADGKERMEALEYIYFKKSLTMDGAAERLNVSLATIKRWCIDFVTRVGRNAGY